MKWMYANGTDEDAQNIVEVEGCHLYFTGEITAKTSTQFARLVRDFDKQQRVNRAHELNSYESLTVHINSVGGSVTDAFAMYDVMNSVDMDIITIAEGMCASAATVVLLAGRRRIALPHTSFLIHQIRGQQWGTFEQVEDDYKWASMLMEQIINIYTTHMTLNREELQALLRRDSWFDAVKAFEYGLVTGVHGRSEIVKITN